MDKRSTFSRATFHQYIAHENRQRADPFYLQIINIADFFMRWTNGVYKSTVHRVVNRTDKERYSVPFFFSINYDQVIEASLLQKDISTGED